MSSQNSVTIIHPVHRHLAAHCCCRRRRGHSAGKEGLKTSLFSVYTCATDVLINCTFCLFTGEGFIALTVVVKAENVIFHFSLQPCVCECVSVCCSAPPSGRHRGEADRWEAACRIINYTKTIFSDPLISLTAFLNNNKILRVLTHLEPVPI